MEKLATTITSACIAAAFVAACSSGLGTNGSGGSANDPAAARATGLGLDLGLTLAERIEDGYAIAGALIPGVTPEEDRRIAFIAFSTLSDADDANGFGDPLVRDAVAPSDNNGAEDVFVIALEDELIDIDNAGAHPAAFSRALVNTFRHDRCVHCHAIGTAPGPGEQLVFPGDPHPGGAEPIVIEDCDACHSGANVPDLEGVEWRAPLEANGDFDFRGNSLEQLATKAMSVPIENHLLNDGRVRWAIESGNVPFVPPRAGGNAGTSALWNGLGRDVGAVPISFATFRAQLLAWQDGGFQVTAASSVRDVVLVSRAQLGNSAANGESRAPSIAWVPNPAYDPSNPTAQSAGQIVVAFESDASNIVGGGNTNSDVYRAAIPLFTESDPATGGALAGGIDLRSSATTVELVSENSSGTGSANGNSTDASIDGSGEHIVFRSTATNLIAGFTDGNGGGSDVYWRDFTAGATTLVSRSESSATTSGDGSSMEGTVSQSGLAIAFSSEASDLVTGDTNGQRDVFSVVPVAGAIPPVNRASVRSNGIEGTGGANYEPSIAVAPSGRVSVTFTSDAQDLAPVAAMSNVFLREEGVLTLLSQRRASGVVAAGNGVSVRSMLSPTGDAVVYETLATNVDDVRPNDGNGVSDVVRVDLRSLRTSGAVAGRRLSVDSLGQDAEMASAGARVGAFRDSIGSFATSNFALYRSSDEGLGFTRQDLITTFLNDADEIVRTDFSADVEAGPPDLTVTFTDASNGDPSSWAWDFGDGTTSTEQSPVHTYTAVGEYDVELTVTRGGATATVLKSGFVRVLEPLSITGFSATDTNGPAPFQTTFSAVLAGSQENISYLWDFGDGDTSTNASPTHTYANPGTYDVSLSVTGLAGSDMATELNYISVIPATGANFTFIRRGLEVEFVDQSVGSPSTYFWQFGDGSTSSQQEPTHRYDDNGSFLVQLTVNGPGGMSSTSRTVTTIARPFEDVYTRFAPNGCNSCHTGGTPSGGLLLNANRNTVFAELVNVLAEGGDCAGGGLRRVRPYQSNQSLLLETVTPIPAPCNSGNGMGSWSFADRTVLREWIDDGAARN